MASRGSRCAASAAVLLLSACGDTREVKVPQMNAAVTKAVAPGAPVPSDPSAVPPVAAGDVVKVNLVLLDRSIEIAPGIKYRTWTFNGTVPGR
jgi:hypothetical protein